MFFSSPPDDGSRHGGHHSAEIDDLDDPHIQTVLLNKRQSTTRIHISDWTSTGMSASMAITTTASVVAFSKSRIPPGWLAHMARSPRKIFFFDEVFRRMFESPSQMLPWIRECQHRRRPIPPPPQTRHSLSLTDSLLPRDGFSRPP